MKTARIERFREEMCRYGLGRCTIPSIKVEKDGLSELYKQFCCACLVWLAQVGLEGREKELWME